MSRRLRTLSKDAVVRTNAAVGVPVALIETLSYLETIDWSLFGGSTLGPVLVVALTAANIYLRVRYDHHENIVDVNDESESES